MEIESLRVGQLETNCYLVFCPKTKEVVIIDPGDAGDFISQKILDLKLKPKLILATHGHFDHLLAVTELKLVFNIPLLMHKGDLFLLKRVKRTAEYFLGYPADLPPAVDRYLTEGEVITFGKERLKVVETPGHTPGGVSFYGSASLTTGGSAHSINPGQAGSTPKGGQAPQVGVLFSGDTLFCQGVGRTDFSYCSYKDLMKSLQKLFKLPGKTLVYPGHGSETNLVAEQSFFRKVA